MCTNLKHLDRHASKFFMWNKETVQGRTVVLSRKNVPGYSDSSAFMAEFSWDPADFLITNRNCDPGRSARAGRKELRMASLLCLLFSECVVCNT